MSKSDLEIMKARLEILKRNRELSNKQKEEEKSKEEAAAPQEATPEAANKALSDECSVWIGSLDYSVTKEQLEQFFSCCGAIKRSTINVDFYTHKPKGFAYIEFENKEAAKNALSLNNELFAGKNIKVKPKKDMPHNTRRRRVFRRQ